MKKIPSCCWAVFVLIAVSLCYYYPIITEPDSIQPGYDMVSYYYPYWQYIREHYEQDGEMPLWNESILGGTTIIGNAHFSLFYPLNQLFLFMPFTRALHLWNAVHLFIAGLGCFLLLKYYKIHQLAALYGSFIFMFGAHMAVRMNIGHYDHLSVMAWIPFSFLFLNRLIDKSNLNNSIFFGIFLGIHLLTLHLQIFYYSIIGLAVFSVCLLIVSWKRDGFKIYKFLKLILLFLFSGLIAFGISCSQLLTVIQSVPLSHRTERTFDMFSKLSLPPLQIFNTFFPEMWGSGSNYIGAANYWELSCFIGFSSIFVLIWAYKKKSLIVKSMTVVGLIALLFSLGRYTPLGKLLFYFPFMSFTRIPARFLVLFIFSLAVISAFGFQNILEYIESKRKSDGFLYKILITISSFTLILYLSALIKNGEIIKKIFFANSPDPGAGITFFKSSILKALLISLFLWIIFSISRYFKLQSVIPAFMLLSLLFLELFFYNLPLNQPTSIKQLEEGYEGLQTIKKESTNDIFRVWGVLYAYQRGLYKYDIERIDGYEPLIEKNLYDISTGMKRQMKLDQQMYFKYLFNFSEMSNTKYLFFSRKFSKYLQDFSKNGIIYLQGAKFVLYQVEKCNPRAFYSDTAVKSSSLEDFYNFVLKRDYRKAVYTEDFSLKGSGEIAAINAVYSSTNKVYLDFNCDKAGIVILNDILYPGWKAFLDDKQVNIIRANYAFRGVIVEAGKHRLEFVYEPTLLNIGKKISFITMIGVFICLSVIALNAVRKRTINDK